MSGMAGKVGAGVLIGLRAAVVSTVVLLLAGALGGRGFHILADAGAAMLPSVIHWATGVSAALSYLLSHTLLYMLVGIVALALVGLPDRLPPLITGSGPGLRTDRVRLSRFDHRKPGTRTGRCSDLEGAPHRPCRR